MARALLLDLKPNRLTKVRSLCSYRYFARKIAVSLAYSDPGLPARESQLSLSLATVALHLHLYLEKVD